MSLLAFIPPSPQYKIADKAAEINRFLLPKRKQTAVYTDVHYAPEILMPE